MNKFKLLLLTAFSSTFLAHSGTQYLTQPASNITWSKWPRKCSNFKPKLWD
ncbi:hypothetical protein PPE03_33480 [Pseudoalteromonas peptidolytica]|nr:hypothetical protein PPE03_33480 [Pseudoalteromonas peptidolytica]